jgi:hypothetical protein
MANIFRAPLVTRIAVLSTVVAVNAQTGVQQNRLLLQPPPRSTKDYPTPVRPRMPQPYVQDVRNILLLYPAPGPKPKPITDFPPPKRPIHAPYVQDVRNRHVFLVPPNPQPPFNQDDWPSTTPPIRSVVADAILNTSVLLLRPVGTPFNADDWSTVAPQPRPVVVHHLRQQLNPSVTLPFSEQQWAKPAALPPLVVTEPIRNRLPLPVSAVVPPFNQDDWGLPARLRLQPTTSIFYYLQDQTSPAFIQFDWPKAPRLPSIPAEQVANRLVLPTVVVVLPPFNQDDWPNASTRQIAKIVDPYNRNVLLPPAIGQPGHQLDWPLPQGARSLQGSHTVNDLGILSVPVAHPVLPIDWPRPAPVMLLTVMWIHQGTSPLYVPTFRAEWAVNSNQVVGPWAPQPETH